MQGTGPPSAQGAGPAAQGAGPPTPRARTPAQGAGPPAQGAGPPATSIPQLDGGPDPEPEAEILLYLKNHRAFMNDVEERQLHLKTLKYNSYNYLDYYKNY